MKQQLLTCFCITISIITCISQESIYPNHLFTTLTHVTVSGDNIYAVGTCGSAQISVDEGVTWEIFLLEDDSGMRDIEIKPGSNGNETYLFHSDGLYSLGIDKTFTELNTSSLNAFGKIVGMEIDEEYIYLISEGAIHKALHTTLEWEFITEIVYDSPYIINTTSSSPSNLFICSRDGHVFQTNKTNGGYTEISNLGERISKMEMANDQVGYLTRSGAPGPYKTLDGGNTWTQVLNWAENNPVHVYNENIFLTANTNRYFVSTDGGATSTSHYEIGDDTSAGLIHNVAFSDDGTIYMVGEASTVIKSTDFGESYDNLMPYVRSRLYNIDMKGISAIASGYGAILTSDDSGANWTEYSNDGTNEVNDAVIIDIGKYAIASDNGVTIINNGVVESTAGAGANRIIIAPDNNYLLASMQIGSSHVISKSTDNGLSWSNKFFNSDYLGDIKINSDGLIYITSGEGKYIKSSDHGENWEEVTLPAIGYFTDIAIENGVELYSIGGALYESFDNGMTLSQIASGYLLSNLHILNDDHYTYTSGQNSSTILREKKPGSSSFTTVEQSCGTSYGSFNKGNGEVWYTKAGGHITKYNFDISTSAVDIKEDPVDIFPNPIRSGETLYINEIAEASTISIINNLGKVVIRVIDVKGNIDINTSTLATGNYYLKISELNNTKTAKLVVF